jgi:hypothetical protein
MNFHLTIRVTRPAHSCLLDLITLCVLTEEQLRHFENWMWNLEVCKYFVVEATVLGFFSQDINGSKSFIYKYISHGATTTSLPGPPYCRGFTTIEHTTFIRTPLDEWSARHRRPLPDKIQHSQQKDIQLPAGFESTIPARERLQTHAIDRALPPGSEAFHTT